MATRAGAVSISRRRAADTYVAWRPLLKDRPARSPPNTKELGSLLNANTHLWKGRDRTEVMACLQMLVYRGVFAKESCATALFGRKPSHSASAITLPMKTESRGRKRQDLSNKAEPRGGQGLEATSGPPLPAEPSPQPDATSGRPPPAERPVDSSQPEPNATRARASASPRVGDSSSPRPSPPVPRVAIPAGAPSLVEGEKAFLYINFGHLFTDASRVKSWKYDEVRRLLHQSPIPLETLSVPPVHAVLELLRQNVFHSEGTASAIFPWLSHSVISECAHRWSTTRADSPPPGPSPAAERDKLDRLMRGEAGHRVPFKTQHVILSAAQEALEESCFDWTGKTLPRLLRLTGWDCPAAGELNRWVGMFDRDSESNRLLSSAADGPENLARILVTMEDLRRVTVHRYPLTSQQISKYVHTAVEFVRLLEDGQRAQQLERVACKLDRLLRMAERRAAGLVADLETIRQTRAKVDEEKQVDMLKVVQDAFRRNALGGENEDEYAAACFDLLKQQERELEALDRKEQATKKKLATYRRWERNFLGGSLEEFALRAFGKALPVEFQRKPLEATESEDGKQGDDSPAAANAGIDQAEAQG